MTEPKRLSELYKLQQSLQGIWSTIEVLEREPRPRRALIDAWWARYEAMEERERELLARSLSRVFEPIPDTEVSMRYMMYLVLTMTQAQPPLEHGEQDRLAALWPASVPMPSGMRFYAKTRYTQRIAVTNDRESNFPYRLDQDDHWSNAPSAPNPNRLFPWAVSGGLHESTGWESHAAVYLPPGKKILVWRQRVPVPSSNPLRKICWEYPEGTVFADLLVADGECFTLRLREKLAGGWRSRVAGARKACAECHDHAGSSLQYGIVLRGDDGAFSASPFLEGTLELDGRWPLESVP